MIISSDYDILPHDYLYYERKCIAMALKDEIRLRRVAMGMAQHDLASALAVCPSSVYKWETGRTKPRFKQMLALTKLFGVSEQELLNSTPREKNEDSKNVP